MRQKIYAVITGDMVNSTAIKNNYHTVLQEIADDIKNHQAPDFIFDVYRGDSFQALINDPAKALLISIIFRAGIRRKSRGTSLNDVWDARLAIGIGPVKNFKINPNIKLGALDGEAFTRSGRTLDAMKNEGTLLKITTGEEQIDKEFAAICPLADTIISHWTTAQAEAIYLYLLKDMTQRDIGNQLKISQRAISKRLESSNLESMSQFLIRFKEIMEWKFNS